MFCKKTFILAVFLTFSLTGNAGVRVPARLKKIAPSWVAKSQWVKNVNSSYLDCTLCDVKSKLPKTLIQNILDPAAAKRASNDFWVYQNKMELKQQYGLMNGPLSQYEVQLDKFNPNGARFADVYATNRALTESIKNQMIDKGVDREFQDYQHGPALKQIESTSARVGKTVDDFGKKIRGEYVEAASAKKSIAQQSAKKTPEKATSLAAAKVTEKTEENADWLQAQLGTKSDLEAMRGQVFMNSKLFNTEVDLVATQPLTSQFNAGIVGGRIIQNMHLGASGLDRVNAEKVRFRLYKTLPLLDVNANWFYGVSSNTMTSTLSKQFTSFLRAEISRVDYMSMPVSPDQRIGLFLERSF